LELLRTTVEKLEMSKYREIYTKTSVHLIVAGDINSPWKNILRNTHYFYIVECDMYLNNTPQRIVAFPFQHWARESAKMLRYTYIAYRVSPVSYESSTPTTSQW